MDEDELGAFAARVSEFMEAMTEAARPPVSPLAERIRAFLGPAADEVPVTTTTLPGTAHPNLQLALDDVLAGAELIGLRARHLAHMDLTFMDLLAGEAMSGVISLGPPLYNDVEVGDGRVVRCVTIGVYLAERDGAPVVVSIMPRGDHGFGSGGILVELLSAADGVPSAVLADLRAAMTHHNVYRGRIISLHGEPHEGGARVQFHSVPATAREHVILPDGTLERLERHAIGVMESAERLRAAGRHLKRGVLLHGPPGTGKTLTVSYLLAAMPGRTVVLLTGRGLGFIEHAIAIGRELAPATVVFEDVDLVAAERTMGFGDNSILFELLNQMEGLGGDEDLLFLLTTNRADLLEPALAARPGRIDLALEIPLPDAEGRARLLSLYLGDAEIDAGTRAAVVERTDGASGAFIRELIRQAALTAALDERDAPGPDDLTQALEELLADRSAITRRLLGEPGDDDDPPPPSEFAVIY